MEKSRPTRYAVDCSSVVEGCHYQARGETADDATQRLMAHARNDHHIAATPDMAARARDAVRYESS